MKMCFGHAPIPPGKPGTFTRRDRPSLPPSWNNWILPLVLVHGCSLLAQLNIRPTEILRRRAVVPERMMPFLYVKPIDNPQQSPHSIGATSTAPCCPAQTAWEIL